MRLAALVVASLFVAVGCSEMQQAPEGKGSTGSLIVGGTNAKVTDYEGMIQTENDETGPWCGATLIAPDWAVSAAHCVIADLPGQGFQRAVLGRQLANGNDGESIAITQVIRHEAYNAETNENDIALLKLAKKSTKKPVRIATAAEWPTLKQANTPVTVIGWGATSEGGNQSNSLLQVTVPIITEQQCNQQYQGIIDERQVCAGLRNGGKDSCQGDSGGPLFEKVDGENIQVGVVSFGNGCARANFAGVYTAVASFRTWIDTNTKGAVPATSKQVGSTPTTADAGAPDAAPATPDNASTEGSSEAEDTGSATPDPVGTTPTKATDTDDASSSDEDEDEKPTKKTKKSKTVDDGQPAQRVAACAMSSGTGGGELAFTALFGIALVAAARRRRNP